MLAVRAGSVLAPVLFIFRSLYLCVLSVSGQYLALDEYHTHLEPHSQTTRPAEGVSQADTPSHTGFSPSMTQWWTPEGASFSNLSSCAASLAVTEAIPVGFSSAY
ncbi:hypothetical protein N7507_011837 [Penicillium longicatenatum]|nr:hypothetical protein N7507_011837 [Penicillium longicatenatum]